MDKVYIQEVYETTDYDKFKFIQVNRGIQAAKVRSLAKSLREKNLMLNAAVIVTSDMTIIDGQHRVKAAEEAEVPVFYKIDDSLTVEDLMRLNSSGSNWSPTDFLESYCGQGKEEYLKFKQFCEENHLTLQGGLVWTGFTSQDLRAKFRNGEFVFKLAPGAAVCLAMTNWMIETLKDNNFKHVRVFKQRSFQDACRTFFSHPSVDHARFRERWETCSYALEVESSRDAYLTQLVGIYNFNMKRDRLRIVKDGLRLEIV